MRTWFLVTCCLLLLAVSLVSGDTQPSTLPVSPPPPFNDDGLAAAEYNKDDDEQQETKKKDGIFALLHHIEGVSLSLQNHRPLRTNVPPPVFFLRRRHDDLRKLRGGGAAANNEAAGAGGGKSILPTTNNSTASVKTTRSSSSSSLLSAKWIDEQARSMTLAFAWVVSAQALLTGLSSFREQVFEFASRFVKQDTLSAARSIRQMLETMDDHGIVDLLAHHEPTQILVCIYALSKLQAACQFYERSKTTTSLQEETNNVVDLALLQDLYDCIPFATAAYGWKFNLATSGKWHKGDRQALVKMTQVDPSDIVTVNWEARPNRPVSTLL
mmetsp:Transcript_4903/g.11665  ORF Transcript_4903/g.11665 Transcript_4903/m.11665 type:complete len:327 (-) Transcript_4903:102-1082(-)